MIQLRLLGRANLDGVDRRLADRLFAGPKRLGLLVYLVLSRPPGLKRRDTLAALLWPDFDQARARHALRNTLHELRGALGEDAFVGRGREEVGLRSGALTCDVLEFEALLAEGRPGEALAFYDGDLLDGFHVSGAAPEYDEWLADERNRLARLCGAALEQLARAAEEARDFPRAVEAWRRLCARDPLSGRAAGRLMAALEAAGDRAGALRHAEAHADLLRQRVGGAPDPDVTALADRLRELPMAAAPASRSRDEVDGSPDPEAIALAERPRVEPPAPPAPKPAVSRLASPSPDQDASSPPSGGSSASRRNARAYPGAAVALLLVLAVIGVYGIVGERTAGPPAGRSLGVLPFVNMSPDPANAYFSDGLSEQIISRLSRIDGLRVAARTSSFALRDRRLDVRAIGDTLGVEAVLEGSVRRDGRRLRVTAQLIDASTGYHVWSGEYDRELEDIFAVQEEIARAIAGALELRYPRRVAATRAGRPPDFEAYDLYLRGLFLRNSLTVDALRQAADYFDRAIEIEPDFALAYAAKASVIGPQIFFRHVPREKGVSEMRAAVARALELDPGLGEAYAVLGILRLFFDWDWQGAEDALRRAIELSPSDPHAYHMLGNYLRAMDRREEAVVARRRAVELDPLNARSGLLLGVDYAAVGALDQAMIEYRRALRLDPLHPLALGLGPTLPIGPAGVHLRQGRHGEAVEEYLRIATLRAATTSELDSMRSAFARSGMSGFWRSWLEMDLRQSGPAPDPLRIAGLWALAGDTARALAWLDRAYEERNPGLIFLRSEPAFESLRSHPRVARILTEMRFPAP